MLSPGGRMLYYSRLLKSYKITITVWNFFFFLDDKFFLKSVAKYISQKIYQLNRLKYVVLGQLVHPHWQLDDKFLLRPRSLYILWVIFLIEV